MDQTYVNILPKGPNQESSSESGDGEVPEKKRRLNTKIACNACRARKSAVSTSYEAYSQIDKFTYSFILV
jgi:hypothetical protein